MNIIFIEDNDEFISQFKPQLQTLGIVTHFKSVQSTILFLNTSNTQFDLVVCDHNLLRFETESQGRYATGNEIYDEIRLGLLYKMPFIHFSYEPCHHEYINSQNDPNFYILKKDANTDLLDFIKNSVFI